MFAVAGAVAMSGLAGMATNAIAGNTLDKSFSYSHKTKQGTTVWRDKYDDTKVYVHPISGPKTNYRVQGLSVDMQVNYRSKVVAIPTGVEASITNYVYENDDIQARLRMTRSSYQNKITRGVWSPDSTRNYSVYPR